MRAVSERIDATNCWPATDRAAARLAQPAMRARRARIVIIMTVTSGWS